MQHSELGASSAARWMACPSSVRLSHGLENKSSPFAAEGTRAHDMAEELLNGGAAAEGEMYNYVMEYVNLVKELGEGKEVFIEEKFKLDWIDESMFGTNDACIIDHFNKLTVIDLKYGKGVLVEAVNNKQLLYYALGASKFADVDKVEMIIVQPRCPDANGEVIRRWEISMEELKEFENELRDAVKRTKDPNAPASAGSHCRFCLAAPTCKELRDHNYGLAKNKFEDVSLTLPNPEDLSGAELTKVLEGANLLSGWVKQVEGYAYEQAQRGIEISGYKLVKKRSNRKWVDQDKVVADLEDVFGDDLFEPKKLKTPAKLEKIVGRENVEGYTEKPEAGETLVAETDRRKAIVPRIEQRFTKVTKETKDD